MSSPRRLRSLPLFCPLKTGQQFDHLLECSVLENPVPLSMSVSADKQEVSLLTTVRTALLWGQVVVVSGFVSFPAQEPSSSVRRVTARSCLRKNCLSNPSIVILIQTPQNEKNASHSFCTGVQVLPQNRHVVVLMKVVLLVQSPPASESVCPRLRVKQSLSPCQTSTQSRSRGIPPRSCVCHPPTSRRQATFRSENSFHKCKPCYLQIHRHVARNQLEKR